jgi:hypothetical protein
MLLWKLNIHYLVYKSLPLDRILTHSNLAVMFTCYFRKIDFNIKLPSASPTWTHRFGVLRPKRLSACEVFVLPIDPIVLYVPLLLQLL